MRLIAEEWRPVPGYEGLYDVSSLGEVRSLDRRVKYKAGHSQRVKGRILKHPTSRNGYPVVALNKLGVATMKYVHQLVLEAFVGPRPDGAFVLHWDDVKTNNCLGNLRWGSRSENAQDSLRNNGHPSLDKTHCPRSHQLTEPNLVKSILPHRDCKACARERASAHRHKRDFNPEKADEHYERIVRDER